MKISVLSAAISVIAFSFCASTGAAETHGAAHWSYEGGESPAHWGKLSPAYADCARGKNQSPVDFSEAEPVRGGKIDIHYEPLRYAVSNNGHTVQAVPDGPPQTLKIGRYSYVLKQFHFHTPSEHTFRHEHFPMEVHFVHQGVHDPEALAVLGVVFKEGPENPALAPLLSRPLHPGQTLQLQQLLDISPLFPAKRRHFHLNGSLTTPPCSEGVSWTVFETPVSASKAQIEAMRTMIGHPNNRPVQPLNARTVLDAEN